MYRCSCAPWCGLVLYSNKKIVTVFIVFRAGEKWVGFGDKTSFQGILCEESLSRLEGSASQPSYFI